MSEMGDSGSDVYIIGGPELEAEIAKIEESQAGNGVANSEGSDEAEATSGGKAGGESKAGGDGKAGAGQDAKTESSAEASHGSAGGETATEPGEGKPAGAPESPVWMGGPELEAEIATTQKLQAGTEVANSGGSGEAEATSGGKAGGESRASGDGKAGAGLDAKAESSAEASHGSAGRETATEPGEGKPAGVPASDGYIGGLEVEKGISVQKVQDGLNTRLNDPNTRDQFPDGYDPFHGDTPKQYFDKYVSGLDATGKLNWRWPDNHNGAVEGTESPTELQEGELLDRYGPETGYFLCPAGTSYPERSLPADRLDAKYHQYKVVRPLPVNEAKTAPAFGEPGGGIQFRTDRSVRELIDAGYLEEVRL